MEAIKANLNKANKIAKMAPLHESLRRDEDLLFRISRKESPGKKLSTPIDQRLHLYDPICDLNRIDDCGNTLRWRTRKRSDSHDASFPTRRLNFLEIDGDYTMQNQEETRFDIEWRERQETSWLIPTDHPLKLLWDSATLIVSFIGAYNSHTNIRDRSYVMSPIAIFCEVWFLIDIFLNFVTQRKSGNVVYKDFKTVCARYLTTWFFIDAVSLVPWEWLYVKPIVDLHKRRGFFKKSFFRTKAVIRVSRFIRGRHFKMFGKVANTTKHAGVNARRLLRLIIKYVPKYVFFVRRMKAIVVMRFLRKVHHLNNFTKTLSTTTFNKADDETVSLSCCESYEISSPEERYNDLYQKN